MRIEICGPIGSGKTSLTSLLAGDVLPIYEDFKTNPFWKAFYANPGAHVFETEITFFLQHYHQLKNAVGDLTVSDFSLLQDLAFARIGLLGNRLAIFESLYDECLAELGQPDLIIFLKCSPEVLLNRIASRGRIEEKSISLAFIQTLCSKSLETFEKIISSQPSLIIESESRDFVNQKHIAKEVRDEICSLLKLL